MKRIEAMLWTIHIDFAVFHGQKSYRWRSENVLENIVHGQFVLRVAFEQNINAA